MEFHYFIKSFQNIEIHGLLVYVGMYIVFNLPTNFTGTIEIETIHRKASFIGGFSLKVVANSCANSFSLESQGYTVASNKRGKEVLRNILNTFFAIEKVHLT